MANGVGFQPFSLVLAQSHRKATLPRRWFDAIGDHHFLLFSEVFSITNGTAGAIR